MSINLRDHWSTVSVMESVKYQVRECFPKWEIEIHRDMNSNSLLVSISKLLHVPFTDVYAGFLPLRLNELFPVRMRASERKITIKKVLNVRGPRYTSTLRVK
jgi:hypothetical protein